MNYEVAMNLVGGQNHELIQQITWMEVDSMFTSPGPCRLGRFFWVTAMV